MSAVGPMEYRKDSLGDRFYASRNYNDLNHTYKVPGSNRTGLDWNLTLRQQRKNFRSPYPLKDATSKSASAPNLLTSELQARRATPLANEHPDGAYHGTTETMGKYQNYAGTVHMLQRLNRVSSGSAQGIDWMLNLRDGHHQKPDDKWRRHFTRSQPSFDVMKENCHKDNQEYQAAKVTPQDRRPDRFTGAISIATIRDDPISFRRVPGCEGTQVGQWEHLITHRRYGHKARRSLTHETTLREDKDDPNGARIEDTRSDGCIVEMLGKKKWTGHVSPDFMAAPPPHGDVKLHHLSKMRIQAEPDEENRQLRMNKQKRHEGEISEHHAGEIRKKDKT